MSSCKWPCEPYHLAAYTTLQHLLRREHTSRSSLPTYTALLPAYLIQISHSAARSTRSQLPL